MSDSIKVLDARPDRIDFRDRVFRPRLVSLPSRYPTHSDLGRFATHFVEHGMILDQRSEGACTGFGLAAVINYLNCYKSPTAASNSGGVPLLIPPRVSEWMLYSLARLYDEWEGEDYSGSSCRGAMKGWHKHGVCAQKLWRSLDRAEHTDADDSGDTDATPWHVDAALRPLGAYFRVNVLSISDMQAAIHEVGAVYCSARVHKGWSFQGMSQEPDVFAPSGGSAPGADFALPVIRLNDRETGGHAFAVVGYNELGFVVQNSWGEKWAKSWGPDETAISGASGGFAIMTYEDWVLNAHDAWVATLAAPMRVSSVASASVSRTRLSLLEQTAQTQATARLQAKSTSSRPAHWSEHKAYEHSIVMGNDGKLIRRRVDIPNGLSDLHATIGGLLDDKKNAGKDIVIYAHGGLNSEADAIRRAQVLGPWLDANGLLPIFVIWRTGFLDTVSNIGQDVVNEFLHELERAERSGILGVVDRIRDRAQKKFDRAFEAAAEKVLGKAVWSQIKQNAEAACQHNAHRDVTGGMRALTDLFKNRAANQTLPRIHLLGHSAGSIILGHFAMDLARNSPIGSVGLMAPACTLRFANRTFLKLVNDKSVPADKLYIFNLDRRNERSDTVGPYNKSLLYLVSRAFEVPRKSPLLGLDDSWILTDEKGVEPRISTDLVADKPRHMRDVYSALSPYYSISDTKRLSDVDPSHYSQLRRLKSLKEVIKWREFASNSGLIYEVLERREALLRTPDRDGLGDEKLAPMTHGILDNDVEVVNRAMKIMLGRPLPLPVTDLTDA